METSLSGKSNNAETKNLISGRLYAGIIVIFIYGCLGILINHLSLKYKIFHQSIEIFLLISLLLISYSWLSVFIYQMTRSHQFVIDFEYIINQGFETSSSVSHIPLNMELKASMYPPNAKISDFPNCNTPDNIPEPLAEIERNKIRENRLKNRKRLSAGCYSNNNK